MYSHFTQYFHYLLLTSTHSYTQINTKFQNKKVQTLVDFSEGTGEDKIPLVTFLL